MKNNSLAIKAALMLAPLLTAAPALAQVSASQAAQLNTTLTPIGAERAGSADGRIPAWTGGMNIPGTPMMMNGRIVDPFATEQPLIKITAANMAEYAQYITPGLQAIFQKYPSTFYMLVYPTHRTAAMPQFVYNDTFKNATDAEQIQGPAGPMEKGAYGGPPFPIPQNGTQVMLNTILRYEPPNGFTRVFSSYLMSSDGSWVKVIEAKNEELYPYYIASEDAKGFLNDYSGNYLLNNSTDSGPPIDVGQALVAAENVNELQDTANVYLPGERRVRELPNPCCDTLTPFSNGTVMYDEVQVWNGNMSRYNWTLLGKKEMYVPYNDNGLFQPTSDSAVLSTGFLNPQYLRWELHRVWVVQATLKPGARDPVTKSTYYVDEDTWQPLIAERYDSKGELWRVPFNIPAALPGLPGDIVLSWGVYDLIDGTSYISTLLNDPSESIAVPPSPYPLSTFSPDALMNSLY